MKTLRELNLEYWDKIHDMCKGTALEGREWECVKVSGMTGYLMQIWIAHACWMICSHVEE